jgi:hypothetical protein
MNQNEASNVVECSACRELVSPEWGTCYRFADDGVLCFECSVHRGGRFDAWGEGWFIAPALGKLARRLSTPPSARSGNAGL